MGDSEKLARLQVRYEDLANRKQIVSEQFEALSADYAVLQERVTALQSEREALRAQLEAREWQPIESAPKDGTKVIVGWLGVTGNTGRFDQWTKLWFDSSTGKIFSPEQPTHFWPLPAPPVSQQGKVG